MDESARKFQKDIALVQIAITILLTIGAIFITIGLSQQNTAFTLGLAIMDIKDKPTYNIFNDLTNRIKAQADQLLYLGTGIIGAGVVSMVMFWRKK